LIFTVLCARNEEAYLPRVLESLKAQTMPPTEIIVVDDGSTDSTAEIAKKHGCTIVHLPPHERSHAGTPEMARKFNAGFNKINARYGDYIMIVGSDDEFCWRDYIERVVKRMEAKRDLVVASGQLEDQPSDLAAPRGGGRLVKAWYWNDVMHGRYPDGWAWESYITYKAMSLGLKTRGFPDIKFRRLRKEKRSWRKAFGDGRSLYALGRGWTYVVARVAYTLFKSPKNALAIGFGYATAPLKGIEQLDTKEWFHESDQQLLLDKATRIIKTKLGVPTN
jgi:glycosyltransferase involved in cell wall biosynthesis